MQINKENKSQKGAANGYASLGSDSIVPKSQSQGSNLYYDSINGIITLIDARGETHSIDLPIENLFQNASYNNDTQNLTLITNGGGKIDLNLSTLVDLPEIVLSNTNPTALPSAGQKLYIHSDNGNYWMNVNGKWIGNFMPVTQAEKDNWNNKLTPEDASRTVTGFVNNKPLQELGGADKLINGIRIGRGNGYGNNLVYGENVLNSNTDGFGNLAIGIGTLNSNTIGNFNLAISYSLINNTSGSSNLAIGDIALYNNTIGNSNIAIGNAALGSNMEGNQNLAIGIGAGDRDKNLKNVTRADNSTFIGYYARPNADEETNQLVIGNDAIGGGSNTVTIGGPGIIRTFLRGTLNTKDLNIYADNTSAKSNGKIAGDIYRKSTGELMIVF